MPSLLRHFSQRLAKLFALAAKALSGCSRRLAYIVRRDPGRLEPPSLARRGFLPRLSAILGLGALGVLAERINALAAVADKPPPKPPKPLLPLPPVAVGQWQQLTVAPHLRKLISSSGSNSSGPLDPSYALIVEAITPTLVSGIPARANSRPVMGEPGVLYFHGGLHSNYPGNEIDRIVLPTGASTQIVTSISHQPNVPPGGVDSGYGSGSSNYVYRQFGTPLADRTSWQPYSQHTWCKNFYHPDWGYGSQNCYARADGALTDANGYQVPCSTVFPDCFGVVTFNFSEGKYHFQPSLSIENAAAGKFPEDYVIGRTGVSDWNEFRQSMVFMETRGGGVTYVKEWTRGRGVIKHPPIRGAGGFDASSGEGILIKWLEASKFLCLRMVGKGTFDAVHNVFLYNLEGNIPAAARSCRMESR